MIEKVVQQEVYATDNFEVNLSKSEYRVKGIFNMRFNDPTECIVQTQINQFDLDIHTFNATIEVSEIIEAWHSDQAKDYFHGRLSKDIKQDIRSRMSSKGVDSVDIGLDHTTAELTDRE